MRKTTAVQRYFEELGTVKERVRFIFEHWQEAVESDKVLIEFYGCYMPGSTKYCEDTIKRASRYWRNTRKLYTRSDAKIVQDAQLEKLNREVWV